MREIHLNEVSPYKFQIAVGISHSKTNLEAKWTMSTHKLKFDNTQDTCTIQQIPIDDITYCLLNDRLAMCMYIYIYILFARRFIHTVLCVSIYIYIMYKHCAYFSATFAFFCFFFLLFSFGLRTIHHAMKADFMNLHRTLYIE